MSEEEKKEENKNERRFDPELLKRGLRCDLDQYEMLKRCSDKKNMVEWNEWRKENPKEDILLEGANLWEADLRRANLREACLKKAKLMRAYLQGAEFGGAELQDADFSRAIVDGETLIWRCKINKNTKFEGVGLDGARIYPELKQLLEYNIRRMNWEEWYKQHKILKWPVWLFWLTNDYGKSTWRIIWCFFGVAAVFAAIYYFVPGLIAGLHLSNSRFLNIVRAFYFSFITMITGFEDINPNDKSIAGHILLVVQVILGYVLLGALVARLAVLFTAGGPAGEFADENKKDADDKAS